VSAVAHGTERNRIVQVCPNCFRPNPPEAVFCYFDGFHLPGQGPAHTTTHRFPRPFVFTSGRACSNFDELALACRDHWDEARKSLEQGILESFLAGLGRLDLSQAAQNAARYPDLDRGLDQFLEALPSSALMPAVLRVTTPETNLGTLRPRQPRQFNLTLINDGQRLLHGMISCDCDWLAIGAANGGAEKSFACSSRLNVAIHVRPQNLRAMDKPTEAAISIKSSGGEATVVVRGEVPVLPFPSGPLAGARSPRQVAEKVRAAPRETAGYLEDGSIAAWYRDNGWTYPIQVPTAKGLGAVQQFFEALGLTKPPPVEVKPQSLVFRGAVGASLQQVLHVQAREKRPLWAHGASDQHWLQVGPPQLDGAAGILPVTIAAVPNEPGATLQGRIKITANGNQKFFVAVTLMVDGGNGPALPPAVSLAPEWAIAAQPSPPPLVLPTLPPPPTASPMAPKPPPPHAAPSTMPAPPLVTQVPSPPLVRPTLPSPAPPLMPSPVAPPPRGRSGRWLAFVPAGLLALALGGIIAHDFFLQPEGPSASAPGEPVLALALHEDKVGDQLDDAEVLFGGARGGWVPSMRFGIRMVDAKGAPAGKERRLTADPWGRTNNTCLRIDGAEALFGSGGAWTELASKGWEDARGTQHNGVKSVWRHTATKVQVTQLVEVVRGEESNRLDTCLVLYVLENQDKVPHKVGLRFLLDTYIGTNDGVPFTIPGDTKLCADSKDFQVRLTDKSLAAWRSGSMPEPVLAKLASLKDRAFEAREDFLKALSERLDKDELSRHQGAILDGPGLEQVPPFIEALEREDLADPGTVAHIKLKLGERELPNRVTLGAWPDNAFQQLLNDSRTQGPHTGWEVPVRPMKSLWPYDSAVVLYWNERPLAPGGRREVGFAYGLGNVASSERLLLTVDGSFKPGGELTVTALVNKPTKDEKVTLTVPSGLSVLGEATQQVLPDGAAPEEVGVGNRPVTWKVKAGVLGEHELQVESTTGAVQRKRVRIKESSIFD
jgi:hypothetical protein